MSDALASVPFRDAARLWALVAAQSFGGPAGQIGVMHRLVVEERRWVPEHRFAHALQYCMLMPGPEAQQLATYLGWLLHGVRGGLLAGALFVLPGFLSILALSALYVTAGTLPLVQGLLAGLQAAVLAVVAEAVLRVGRRVAPTPGLRAVAVGSFLALFFFGLPYPLVIVAAALLGTSGRIGPTTGPATAEAGEAVRPSLRRQASLAALVIVLWLAPTGALAAVLGPDHVLVRVGIFFSEAAVLTFGGAYAVLAWVAQRAVDTEGWLTAREMLDGLAMAEATPGPLIQVVQHVGFLAAWRAPAPFDPWTAAVLGALLTTWVTFVPSFAFALVGAPFVEATRARARWVGPLAAITAAVVGAIGNLGVWLLLHVLFREVHEVAGPLGSRLLVPEPATLDPVALGVAALSAALLLRLHRPLWQVLALGGLVGVAAHLLGAP